MIAIAKYIYGVGIANEFQFAITVYGSGHRIVISLVRDRRNYYVKQFNHYINLNRKEK